MSIAFTIKESDDTSVTYVGQIVCRGRRRVVLLLTYPYNLAGRIVEIPAESVVNETTHEPSLS